MTEKIIHNIRISYDETDERVIDFVKYLKAEERKEELKSYYEKAHNQGENGLVYLNDKFGNEFSFECTGNHICSLKLRGM